MVLFSHGNGGRYRNHYLTAQILADAGFVVIAPQHEADYLAGGRKTAQALDHRHDELARALKAVREDPIFRERLAPEPVHGVGYSLGGATIMLAAGAGYSSELAAQHCRKNGRTDTAFCEEPGFFQSSRDDSELRPTPDPFRHPPLVTGEVVLVAPVFHGLDLERPLSMTGLTVIAIAGDRIAKPEFHANPLFEAARQRAPARFFSVPGHHFAFIAPFPKWLTDQEEIPVAEDPEGFDRPAFLKTVNAMILDVLTGG